MSKHDWVCNEHPSGEMYIRERSPRGRVICRMAYTGTTQPKIDGATIVRAVNAHDALEDALLRMQARAAVMEDTLRENGPWDDADSRITDEVHEQARAALALAKGE